MELLTWPDSRLISLKTIPVQVFGDSVKNFCDDMAEIMFLSGGAGLAASQVGDPRDIFILDSTLINDEQKSDYIVFCNTKITKASKETEKGIEGCLSLPDIKAAVPRYTSIVVEAKGADGVAMTVNANGFLARAIQHEYDHLRQIYLIDYMGKVKKDLAKKRLIRKKTG